MKHIVFFVTLAASATVWAQAQKPPATAPVPPATEALKPAPEALKPAPEALKPAPAEAKPGAPKAAAKAKLAAGKMSRRQQDARHCLQRTTNDDIIKCAEGYL
jgi:hypothetical protein